MQDVVAARAEEPTHVYYRACHGRWRCELTLRITDLAALRASAMRWADRLSLRMIAGWPRWLGRFFLETSVTYDAAEVVHTTVVRWWGIPLMRSVEKIALDPDGRSFVMRGEQRVFPAVWARRAVGGSGTVDETATRAEYALEWLGVPLQQSTEREADRVTVSQRGPGFAGVQPLARR